MKYIIFTLLIFPLTLFCQSKNGYYMNWNRDHTGRTIKPMIPISENEAQKVNCYWVEFDNNNRFKSVKYFNSGQPSEHSNFGAHELVRNYYSDKFEDTFKNLEGKSSLNASGIKKYLHKLNTDGHWILIENYDENEKLAEENGVAVIKVSRNYQNKILTEIRINLKQDTIPDPNDFKVVHFSYDKNDYMTARINKDAAGNLQDGKFGYATVVFQFDHNGMFFGEEFLDRNDDLVIHPDLGYAKIDFREFNKYGKNTKQYFMDDNGYPSASKSMAIIEYNKNMSRNKVLFYNRIGELTEDFKGRASILYDYNQTGKFVSRKYFNIKSEPLK